MLSRLLAVVAAVWLLLVVPPIAAQDIRGRMVAYGRVEDAITGDPVVGALIRLVDSEETFYTDSLGIFGVPLSPEGPFSVEVDRFGYVIVQFDLGEDADARMSVLRLQPAPIAIEGVTAEAVAALTELVRGLERRRNAYPFPSRAYDRSRLERLAQVGSAYDFVRTRMTGLAPCPEDPFSICVPGRYRTFVGRPPLTVTVCVDGWPSISPMTELEGLPIHTVALVELYGGVTPAARVYTTQWMLSSARTGRTRLMGWFNLGGC